MKAAQNQVKAKGLKIVKATVSRGDPAEEIVKFSKNNDIDMIVIGSRGLGQTKGILLGSVSSKVCHLSECTCVTVK
ncbi:MAG: universal stress protein [Deltaproteobacteria bacterium]|nr:MAG: universal stress protein [Deltaproteobacteria bacterium]